MKIAVDFDGTIVRNAYPGIGKEMPFAFETLRRLQQKHRLILWTVREGELLQEAVDYCKGKGLEFYAVNATDPEEKGNNRPGGRKVNADLFIDDRNVGGLPDWGLIYRIISENSSLDKLYSEDSREENQTGIKRWFSHLYSFMR